MKIQLETTYNLGDLVYYLKSEKIATGIIYKMEASISNEGQQELLYIKPSDSEYSSVVMRPHQVFTSRQQLIDQL